MSTPAEELDINSLEVIEQEHHLTMGLALERLKDNPDFKTVILDGYLHDKMVASVSLLAVPQIKEQGKRGDIMEDLVAGSNLQYFFSMIESFYQGAKDPILSDDEEQELADLEAEGGVQ